MTKQVLRRALCSLVLVGAVASGPVCFAEDGKALFAKVCAACHTIGAGRLVGPDLKGVTDRRTEAWLLEFIASSQAMVNKGDPTAVALFNEYLKIPMPDSVYTAAQNRAIVAYLRESGGAASAAPVEQAPAEVRGPATEKDIAVGRAMFQGLTRFANGGAACNSCHHVRNDAVIGGGVLAAELTSVFSRMSGAGVSAILGSPPFPVMEQAYKANPLTENEIFSLSAFLEDADKNKQFQQPRDYGFKLLGSGAIGAALLLGLYSLVWSRRKRRSVNHAIYARQVRSS